MKPEFLDEEVECGLGIFNKSEFSPVGYGSFAMLTHLGGAVHNVVFGSYIYWLDGVYCFPPIRIHKFLRIVIGIRIPVEALRVLWIEPGGIDGDEAGDPGSCQRVPKSGSPGSGSSNGPV